MKIIIIGHNIDIKNLEDFDYTKGNDSFIYEINDSILAGQDEGDVTINGVSYQWEIIPNIEHDEYENICYENKKMGEFLEKLGLTPDEITSYVINGSNEDINRMIYKIIPKIRIFKYFWNDQSYIEKTENNTSGLCDIVDWEKEYLKFKCFSKLSYKDYEHNDD